MADILDRINTAVVLLDADAPDFEQAALAVQQFFASRDIALKLKAMHRHGWILVSRKTDLFLSLLPADNWHLRIASRISQATLKIGRFQQGQVYDLVVSDAPSGSAQTEVFARMTEILSRIQ